MAMILMIKQPAETLVVDVPVHLAAVTQIVSVTVTPRGLAAGPALVASAAVAVPGGVRVRLDGGADGEIYNLAVLAGDGAQQREGAVDVHVAELGFVLPDGAHPYISPADYVGRYGYEETLRLTDEAGVQRIDAVRLRLAMQDAQAEIDAHIAVRYELPLAQPVPPLIASLMHLLVRAGLHHHADAAHPALVAREHARRALENIAGGRIRLVGALPAQAPGAAAATDNDVLSEGSLPLFTQQSLAGW
jgi:phage gp36-like protein